MSPSGTTDGPGFGDGGRWAVLINGGSGARGEDGVSASCGAVTERGWRGVSTDSCDSMKRTW